MGEMMTQDMTLLRKYARDNSEAAFASLVSTHINMVYSVALRTLHDRHLAEDVTQATFIILAQKARVLGPNTVLSGWLCRTARYAAMNALTMQRRRQHREREAQMQCVSSEPESDVWGQIAPLLETALARLGEKDHDAIVLRFFEGKDFKQVAAALGTGEDAARMRVNRALEKLRAYFTKRGVESATAMLATAISANCVQAAPAGLTACVTAAATGASAAATTTVLVKGTLKLMTWAKIKLAVMASSVVLMTGGTVAIVATAARSPAPVAVLPAAPVPLELPPEASAQLEKQKAAFQAVYFEYTEARRGSLQNWDYTVAPVYTSYFDASHFYRQQQIPGKESYDNEFAFDGQAIWHRQSIVITKTPMADAPSVVRFRLLDWPYIEAAGLHAPGFVPEVEAFTSLEPMALYYLKHNEAAKLEMVGDNPRLTFQVVDPQIIEVQKVDIESYQKELEATHSKEAIASEIEDIKRFKAMNPTRKVALTLDAKHGYAVAEREEWTAAGERIVHVATEAWKFYEAPGIWLPGRCIASYYTKPYGLKDFSKDPVHVVTHELKRVEFGQKDISFTLDSAVVPGAANLP